MTCSNTVRIHINEICVKSFFMVCFFIFISFFAGALTLLRIWRFHPPVFFPTQLRHRTSAINVQVQSQSAAEKEKSRQDKNPAGFQPSGSSRAHPGPENDLYTVSPGHRLIIFCYIGAYSLTVSSSAAASAGFSASMTFSSAASAGFSASMTFSSAAFSVAAAAAAAAAASAAA